LYYRPPQFLLDVPADGGLQWKLLWSFATMKEYHVTTCVLFVVCGAEFKARCIDV
jgi:hypothetical protein